MKKEIELLDETLQRISQHIDLLDLLSNHAQGDMIGPLEIIKRDLQSLYFQINEYLYDKS